MAVFISVKTNSFQSTFEGQVAAKNIRPRVRRPTTGIAIKQESFAYLRVLKSNGTPIELLDGGAAVAKDGKSDQKIGRSPGTTNFMLTQVTEQRMEKTQVVETFGEDYIFFFGEKPRFVTFAGTLMNTQNFNWKNEFRENYEQHFRGTKLLEQDARVYLTFDDTLVEGYMTDSSVMLDTGDPYQARFSFQLFVTNHSVVSQRAVGNVVIPSIITVEDSEGLSPDGAGTSSDLDTFRGRGGPTALVQRRENRIREEERVAAKRNLNLKQPPVHYSDIEEEYVDPGSSLYAYDKTSAENEERAFDVKGELGSRYGYLRNSEGEMTSQEVGLRAVNDLGDIGVQANSLRNQSILTGPNAFAGGASLGSFGLGRAQGEIARPFQNVIAGA